LRFTVAAAYFSALLAAGCATYVTVPLLQKGFQNAVITRSFSLLPLGAEQKVVAVVIWNPQGGTVTQIERETGGAAASKSVFTVAAGESLFKDEKVSAGVKYRYTLVTSSGTRSTVVQPVASVVDQPAVASPGTGSIEWFTTLQKGAAAKDDAVVTGGKPEFKWGTMPSRDASESYGYFLVVGRRNASSSLGIDPVYSAFLEEASHSLGATYGTKSDLQGFSGEIVSQMKNIKELAVFAPTDATRSADGSVAPLPAGNYIWTVLTVNSDGKRISFGIGKISAPTDSKRFRFFCVPDAGGKCQGDAQ